MRFDHTVVGDGRPSTEWRFHLDILRARPEVNAVVHAHPIYCTTLAIMERSIPPIHYMVCAAGGDTIRCAPYATFGTAGAVRQRRGGAQGPESLPSRPSRHDRGRRRPAQRHVACGRSRKPRPPVRQLPAARRRAAAAHAGRGQRTSPSGSPITDCIRRRDRSGDRRHFARSIAASEAGSGPNTLIPPNACERTRSSASKASSEGPRASASSLRA